MIVVGRTCSGKKGVLKKGGGELGQHMQQEQPGWVAVALSGVGALQMGRAGRLRESKDKLLVLAIIS